MSAGIDSLAATELTTLLTDRLGTELEPTVLFDHPTIDSLANFVATTSTPAQQSCVSQNTLTDRDMANIIRKTIRNCVFIFHTTFVLRIFLLLNVKINS